jgi:hypothetical protein
MSFIQLHLIAPPALGALAVQHEPAQDREQPRAKRTVRPKRVERIERPNERILHDLVDLPTLAGTRGEPGECLGVPLHDLGRRPLVSTFPALDEREINRTVVEPVSSFHSVTN